MKYSDLLGEFSWKSVWEAIAAISCVGCGTLFVAVLGGGVCVAVYRRFSHLLPSEVRARRIALGLCPSCGYDLTGNVSGVCPECGTPVGG